ncbi:hypothetical protein GGR57DRAFT_209735 [Xylariaceae sp. FL1272]|nr:hypothetical protein GGR57DRAFT_209735 [Xylariaceae sp. FL1272]
MVPTTFCLLSLFAVCAQTTDDLSALSIRLSQRQATLSCAETYGNGSIPCGAADSGLCFNPSLGQTCCPLDNGFCGKGTYCAPVAGYCCAESEDLQACARNRGFALPDTATSSSGIDLPTSGSATGISRTFTVTPILPVTSEPVVAGAVDATTSDCNETPVPAASQVATDIPSEAPAPVVTAAVVEAQSSSAEVSASTDSPPIVQVAFATREQHQLSSSCLIVLLTIAILIAV